MKKVDVGEFNNSIEYSQFDEFKYFSAEQYYSLEAQKPPLESSSFNEDNLNKENAHSKNTSNVNKDNNFDEARKQYDNLNTSDGSQVPNNLGSSNSGSTFSSSSSSSTTSISSSTSGATTLSSAAATTSSVASIATSAVVAITAVTTFFTFQKEYVSLETGDDYSSITINIDDVIKDDKGLHSFSYDDFIIQFNDGEENRIINFEKGNHTYLVTGLEPNKTYSYDIICNNSSLEKDNVCFTGKVTTTNTKKPKCVYDELNNSITYDDNRKSGIINYSLYLSDYYNEYSDYSLYVCSEPQDDESDIRNVIFESNQLNKNNYFSGSIANITYDKVYLYVVGYNMKAECIYSETIDMNMPNEWAISKNPIIDFDENKVSISSDSNKIIVEGEYNSYDLTKNLEIYINQYDVLNNIIKEKQIVPLVIDENAKKFSFVFDVMYGIDSFTYSIFYQSSSNRMINVYDSKKLKSNISLSFDASYNKVLPKDAIVTYSKDKINIEVDPNYYSDNDNMYYRLEVLNSSGKVYGTYKGREKALFEISEYEGLDKIIFKYYDCSLYLGEEKVFETYLMDGCDFGYHVLDIVEEEMKEETSIDSIIVNGKQNNIDTTKNIKISFNEYDASMNKIRENEEININFLENKTFNAQFNVSYGIKKYDYVIYFYDELGNKIDLYRSEIKNFGINQEFVGSINYIEPNDSDITIDLPNVSISFDTGFTSTYDFMFYKVELYSSDDIFLDSYSGTSPLVTFEIEDLDGKLDFYYKYYKCATFLGDEIIYDMYTTEMNSLENFYFGIDEDSFLHTMDSTSIKIEGKMHGYNLYNGDLHIFVSEYIESGETIRFNEEFIPSINVSDQTFILTFDVSYGIKSFDYYICYEGEDLIEIYRSQKIDYNGNQDFNATYNKIEPKDAKITYLSDGISIEIDTSFTSNKENLFYKVEVLNSLEEVLAYYEGVDKAVIKMTSIDALDKIFFRYTSCGTFNGEKHNFESFLTEGIVFSYPTLTFDEKAIHNGTSFEIGYSLNMAYDYSLATIELSVIKDDIEQANLSINSLKSNGTIDLGIVEELGAVSILSSITFKTYEGNIYTITNESITCDLLYSFEVKKMEIDGTDYSDNMPMTIFFDNKIPSSYKLHITDETNGIDELINSTDVYYRVLDKNNEYTINIQAEDSEGNSFGNLFSYNISLALANDNYVAPTYMVSPNPGDATVTYNEDGTINMYRKVSVEGLPENEYINAFIYSSCTNDVETGRPIYENGYDVITRSEYANIENIPFANYIFKYYEVMEYNGITYLIACNWPSGMVEPTSISATATSSSDGEKTVISVTILNSYNVINKINVDGVDYEYTSYENQYDSNPQLILDGNIEINQITIYLKDYYNDYDTFSNEIEIKGSPEMEITINMLT